jgi:hypothetical protein
MSDLEMQISNRVGAFVLVFGVAFVLLVQFLRHHK